MVTLTVEELRRLDLLMALTEGFRAVGPVIVKKCGRAADHSEIACVVQLLDLARKLWEGGLGRSLLQRAESAG